jgi:DNA topoisomerase IA
MVFPDAVDIGFTSQMESKYDNITSGELEYITCLVSFYEEFVKQHPSVLTTLSGDDKDPNL